MYITWHGYNCIRIQGKEAVIVIDPFSDKLGLKPPRLKADVALASTEDIDLTKTNGNPFFIDSPGEFEVKGVFTYGLPWKYEKHDGTGVLYRIQFEDVSFAHLGALDRVLPNAPLEILEGVDVLFLPVGDPEMLKPTVAVEVISRIEPRIVIPVNYDVEGAKKKLDKPDKFLKELGLPYESESKLKLTNKDLPEDERKVYLLELS